MADSFSSEDIEFLASLPYKVGMWISETDDQDGDADDVREAKVLGSCLRQFAKLHEDQVFVSRIMKESLRLENKWPDWTHESFNVLSDLKKAFPLLQSKASVEDSKSFKRALIEIGTAVAQASNEYGAFDDNEAEGFFGKIMGKFAGLGDNDAGHPMNVSAAEDSALEKLRAALKG